MQEIYELYAKPVHRYLYSLCRSEADAEDMCAETFLRAINGIGGYKGEGKLLTWLCGIAKNVWYQELEKRKKRGQPVDFATLPLEDTTPGPAEVAEAADDKLLLYHRMQTLDSATREVLYLRLGGDLSYREIGEVLGQSENWARVTFYRGKEKLRKGLTGGRDNG